MGDQVNRIGKNATQIFNTMESTDSCFTQIMHEFTGIKSILEEKKKTNIQ